MRDEYLTLMGLEKSTDNSLYIKVKNGKQRIMIGDNFQTHGRAFHIISINQYKGIFYVISKEWSRPFTVTISDFKKLVEKGEIYAHKQCKQPLHSLWLEQTFRTIK